jgi:integrase
MYTPPFLKTNKSGYYEVRWSEKTDSGEWRSRSISTRTTDLHEAETFLEGWKLAQAQTVAQAPHTFEALAEIYLQAGSTRITTKGQVCNLKWLNQYFGAMSPPMMTAAHIAGYTSARTKGTIGRSPAKPATIFKELTTLVTVLKYAAKTKLISVDDIPHVDKPVRSQPRDVWLDETQEAEFLALAAETSQGQPRMTRVHRFVWIALSAGARREAIESLRWEHVDLARGLIDFSKTDPRMTKKRRVQVPISNRLMPVMQKAYAERVSEFVLDTDNSVWDSYHRWVLKTPYGHVTPHDLRRTCATLMARAGVPIFSICGILGDSLEIIQKHYLHHAPGHLVDAINRGASAVENAAENAAEGGKTAPMPVRIVGQRPDKSRSKAA